MAAIRERLRDPVLWTDVSQAQPVRAAAPDASVMPRRRHVSPR